MWYPIETYKKDGTLVFLLIDADPDSEDSNNPTEDAMAYRTIGSNNFDHDGDDIWSFAGWCWTHDHWVDGRGTPRLWQPMPDKPVEDQAGLPEPQPRGSLASQ